MTVKPCSDCGRPVQFEDAPPAECPVCGGAFGGAAGLDNTIAAKPKTPPPAVRQDADKTRPRGVAGADKTMARVGPPSMPADPLIGKELGGCVVETLLGKGAMGAVYRARQRSLDRIVALKTIRPDLAQDEHLLKRFEQEAKTIGRFNTPHVVQVYQVGCEGGVHFLVMEYVAGGNLRAYAHRQPGEKLSTPDAMRFLREACLGLREAERLDVLHRDIKPDNLMLDERGVLKIGDFGIAKLLTQDAHLTMTSEMAGTPLYMSPEQCRSSELDFRTDMYSLGATFYYLLSGRPPAEGSSLFELIQTKAKLENLSLRRALTDPSAAGLLGDVIERMTALDPEDRYGSYDELLADLERTASGEIVLPARLRAEARVQRAVKPEPKAAPKRRPWLAVVAALVVLGGGAAAWRLGAFDGVLAPAPKPPTPKDDEPVAPLPVVVPIVNGGGEATGPTIDLATPAATTEPKPDATAAEVARDEARVAELARGFAESGPDEVATEIAAIVEELTARPAAFDAVRMRARDLDRDVRRAAGVQAHVLGLQAPIVRLDQLDEVESFLRSHAGKQRSYADATPEYQQWLTRAIVGPFAAAKGELADAARKELGKQWERCQSLEKAQAYDGLGQALDLLDASQKRLVALFPDVDFAGAAPEAEVAKLRTSIERVRAQRALRDEVKARADAVKALGLGAWAGGEKHKLAEWRKALAPRLDGADAQVTAELERLDAAVARLDRYAAGLDAALGALAKADLAATRKQLDELGKQDGLAELDGYRRTDAARTSLEQGLGVLFGSLDCAAAAPRFVAARESIEPLSAVVASAAAAVKMLADYERACADLARATESMTPVLSTRVGAGDAGFWLDRTEMSRGAFRAFLVGVRDGGDADAKARLAHMLASLANGELEQNPDLPLERVTFQEADACLRASGKRLPKLPEWRLAALGPADAQTKYPWGDGDPGKNDLNTTGALARVGDGGRAKRFGTGANAVNHLAGNVAEWVETDAETKAYVGGHYALVGVQRAQAAAGRTMPAKATDRLDGVGFRGVLRPREFVAARGLPVPE